MEAADSIPTLGRQPSRWQSILVLFKLRIVALLLMAAYGGAALAVAAGQSFSLAALGWLTLCGGLASAGASALNQYFERERDRQMRRTAHRPFSSGRVSRPRLIVGLASSMIILAGILAGWYNLALACWVLAGAAIYVGIYTLWLKPRTSMNIVIGGAAGSCAVISGGAAMGNWTAPGVWLLAGLLFFWTPVHFWSLALAYREDYAQAAFPMLPVQLSARQAARWTALHTGLTATAALCLGLWSGASWLYLLPVVLATILLIDRTRSLLHSPRRCTALALFHYSNLYLALVLLAIITSVFWTLP